MFVYYPGFIVCLLIMLPTPSAYSLARQMRKAKSRFSSRTSLLPEKNLFVSFLLSKGFELAGEGSFGSVLLLNNIAVKLVLTKESQGYLAYARFCRARHQENRLLPRVSSIHEVGRYTIICMERLYESISPSTGLCRSLRRVSRQHCHVNEVSRVIGRPSESLDQVMVALRKILNNHQHSYWDIRSPNIMFRRERGHLKMVLVDPIAH